MVIGIMGHTQGVSRASRPPAKPISRIIQTDACSSSSALCICTGSHQPLFTVVEADDTSATGSAVATTGSDLATPAVELPNITSKLYLNGGVQLVASQAMDLTLPLMSTAPLPVHLKGCENITVPS